MRIAITQLPEPMSCDETEFISSARISVEVAASLRGTSEPQIPCLHADVIRVVHILDRNVSR